MYINKKVIWHTIEISHTVTCNENLTGELILNEGEKINQNQARNYIDDKIYS